MSKSSRLLPSLQLEDSSAQAFLSPPSVVRPKRRSCFRWLRFARRGAAATEFAVVAPVFFLMVVGFLEFGRALMVQQVLINASRVGARQASTTSATTSEVESTVVEYAASVAVPGVSVAVVPDPSAANPGDPVTVTTSVAFTNVSWMASPWFLGGTTLSASSQMRKEGFE